MRTTRTIAFLALLMVPALAATASPAYADDEFDVNVAGGQVTVTAHGGWHINKDYPWKLVVGDTRLEKAKFTLAETTASVVGAPKGAGTLKGAVCSADQCHAFKKEVTIP
jgi:hypothetical protein